ncbi:MAG TPA: phosphoribosylformylglycinamidine synthase subunit PurS, partial [bacterium]
MITKIELGIQPQFNDNFSQGIKKNILDMGFISAHQVKNFQVFYLLGDLVNHEVKQICQHLLVDPITQIFTINQPLEQASDDVWSVEITYNPGVMDPVEESTLKGIRDLGISNVQKVKTALKYHIWGLLSEAEKTTIVEKILANKVIQHVVQPGEKIFAEPAVYQFKRTELEMLEADDEQLLKISRDGQLFLNLEEMKTIQDYFRKLGRKPTDVELETLAQTWSEHCVHKTFRGLIDYNGKIIDNLLKSTIMKVTRELDKRWCLSVFKDNAGVIEFDENHDVCFKVETHNHPSALEPYGGANTGIGGVIR